MKISVDGKRHFLKTTTKRLNGFLSILATQPIENNYNLVNIKNDALFVALNISYDYTRGYRHTLESEFKFIELSKIGKYHSLDETRDCDRFSINFYNICNFIASLTRCTGKFLNMRAIYMLGKRENLPKEIKDFFRSYADGCDCCSEDFEEGFHYEIKIVDEIDICTDYDDYDDDYYDEIGCSKERETSVINPGTIIGCRNDDICF